MSARNLRIVSENAADSAEITVPNTASGLGAEWLKTELKSEVCRILSDEGTITATWPEPVGVGCVALPAWNGSANSEMRVRIYSEILSGDLRYDSDWQWAASGPILAHYDFNQPLNVNDFAEGATVSVIWVPNISGRRVVIDLRDPERTFLDVSRVVVGAVTYLPGVSYGSGISVSDDTTVTRAASGDSRIDRGPRRRSMSLDIGFVPHEHRHEVGRIINAGLGKRHFFSGYAEGQDVSLVQSMTMYGLLQTVPGLTHVTYGLSATQFQVEEW